MRLRILVGALVLAGGAGLGTLSARTSTQWSFVNFTDAVLVNRAVVSGPVLIVHDEAKMARGEPCTTFYQFNRATGTKEPIVSFHCKPRSALGVRTTTLVTATTDTGLKRLVEYQLAGDEEAHGVPR
jgi:hypothetical protein